MPIMTAMYRAMLRAAIAIDNSSTELAPVARAAIGSVLPTPLSRLEHASRIADVVRTRFRSAHPSTGRSSSSAKKYVRNAEGSVAARSRPIGLAKAVRVEEWHFQIIKLMRAVLQQRSREQPTLYSVELLAPPRTAATSPSIAPLGAVSKLLVVGHTAVLLNVDSSSKSSNEHKKKYKPLTLLQLCKQRHLDLLSSSGAKRSFRYVQDLHVMSGGDVPAPAPILVHKNPLVAHMIYEQRMAMTSQPHDDEDERSIAPMDPNAACYISELREVLKLPPRIVATLNKSNCCVFRSHAGSDLAHRVMSTTMPFYHSDDAISRSLFSGKR